mmetsp:Transcript_58252/g.109042  ORF Transcript_58252/g.109042 Transcript_58252/m.109042 type:complete len:121 (+) Transcript_58252:2-364(+)
MQECAEAQKWWPRQKRSNTKACKDLYNEDVQASKVESPGECFNMMKSSDAAVAAEFHMTGSLDPFTAWCYVVVQSDDETSNFEHCYCGGGKAEKCFNTVKEEEPEELAKVAYIQLKNKVN